MGVSSGLLLGLAALPAAMGVGIEIRAEQSVVTPRTTTTTNGPFPMPLCGTFKLEEATIDEMQQAMEDGTLTSVQLVKCYLERTFQTNEYINSLLQYNPDALDIAAAMDAERAAGNVRGPLHGIPFTVKDNIASKDKMETTAGSWALIGSKVPRDAHVVARMREAGAVLLGKATLSEWADMRSNNYSEGYSGRGGQARSPYNFKVNPGGSSSGSAIGVAGNCVPISLGTETDGSIINPAMRNSLVGIKPSVGRTSRAGIIPESEHQDTVGAIGKTVRDAVYALDAIVGVDARDNYTLAQPAVPADGYASFLTDKTALQGARFGIPWKSYWTKADPEQLRILTAALQLLEAAGAEIVNNTEITRYDEIVAPEWWDWTYMEHIGGANTSEYTVVKVNFFNNIETYLSELENTNIRTLQDIVDFNYANDGSEGGNPWPLGIPAFYSGQDGFLASLETGGLKDEAYWQAVEFVSSVSRNGIDDALGLNTEGATPLDGLLVPPDVAQSIQTPAQAGYPVITVPVGVHSASGMPFGLAVVQTAWKEAELVKWGSAIEDAFKGTAHERVLPGWRDYMSRIIPVGNIYEGSG
ncbi:amidase signature domain-containing protein [Cladorrhinum sp. PSN259]|nr:amidase signature domain-containing protein [Cladorrhinum sp. PSN259]